MASADAGGRFMGILKVPKQSRPGRTRIAIYRAILSGLCAANVLSPASAQDLRAAVFDLDFLDTSPAVESGTGRAEETRRVALVSDMLRRMLAERGIVVVELTGARERIEKAAPLTRCNGCDLDLARGLGAELAVTGTVQKVSNLILNLNVTIRDVRDGRAIRAGFVDIRGNTDESWLRGMSYLVRNRLSDPPIRLPTP
jgi:hypothetical protein